MVANKYYDWKRGVALLESDGCPYDEWSVRHAERSFCIHPKGFLIFLPPDALGRLDEYTGGDPYKLELEGPFHKRRQDVTLELLRRVISDGKSVRILDVACGLGFITNEIHKTFPSAEISAMDGSLTAIVGACSRFSGIDYAVANAYRLPYAEHYFDVVICNNIWEHVPDPLRMLSSISRVLRPGGSLIISTPSRYRFNNLLRALRGRPLQLISKHHVTEYTVGQVIEQLTFSGYKVEYIDGNAHRTMRNGVPQWVALLLPVTEMDGEPFRWRDYGWRIPKVACIMAAISIYSTLTGSKNSLASTVFYLARQNNESISRMAE